MKGVYIVKCGQFNEWIVRVFKVKVSPICLKLLDFQANNRMLSKFALKKNAKN